MKLKHQDPRDIPSNTILYEANQSRALFARRTNVQPCLRPLAVYAEMRTRIATPHIAPAIAFAAIPTVAQYTYLPGFPGWDIQRTCVQTAVYHIAAPIGCPINPSSWQCICLNSDLAYLTVAFRASSMCSGRLQDIASATSLIQGFCEQYPGIPHGQVLQVPTTLAPVSDFRFADQ